MSEFASLPEYPASLFDDHVKKFFSHYLFYITKSRGVRSYTCTACGAEFDAGKSVLRRTEGTALSDIDLVEHNDTAECPFCHEKVQVINVKKRKISRLSAYKYFAIFIPVTENDVWVRCVEVYRRYNYKKESDVLTVFPIEHRELQRYRLQCGECYFYDSYGGREFYQMKTYRDAFLWNHGLYTEKYPYYALYYTSDGTLCKNLDHTFLRHSGYEHYEAQHYRQTPYMKYLAWYCKHPQLEMLAKMHHTNIIDEMLSGNTDMRSIIDWSQKSPAALYKLDGNEYREFMRLSKGNPNIALLKAFNAVKKRGVKAFGLADRIVNFSNNIVYSYTHAASAQKNFLAKCRRYGADPIQIIKYIERFQASTVTGCHHFPGLTMRECYSTWSDYVAMAEHTANGKRIDLMPRDLKAAHDKLCGARDRKLQLERLEKVKLEALSRSQDFPKANAILAKIKVLYEYEGESYVIKIPDSVADIIIEGEMLSHCVGKNGSGDRYIERIEKRESYIMFLRRKDSPLIPFYTLEVEPDGTIRQKRTVGDSQGLDLELALPFLTEWQGVISKRITETERQLAKTAKSARIAEYNEMRKKSIKIARGELAGHLLADVLESDLIENLA